MIDLGKNDEQEDHISDLILHVAFILVYHHRPKCILLNNLSSNKKMAEKMNIAITSSSSKYFH